MWLSKMIVLNRKLEQVCWVGNLLDREAPGDKAIHFADKAVFTGQRQTSNDKVQVKKNATNKEHSRIIKQRYKENSTDDEEAVGELCGMRRP